MLLQFDNKVYKCLKKIAGGSKKMEQTLEIRLPESDRDGITLLGAWGTPIIRAKEWHSDHIGVSGGINCCVLYKCDMGDPVRCVRGWMPFAFRWDMADSKTDGVVFTSCCIEDMDARIIGAGKIMVTAQIMMDGSALEQAEFVAKLPNNLPEDVQVKQKTIDAVIPMESGEKLVVVDEDIYLPDGAAPMETLLYYSFAPEFTEKRVMGDRLASRGNGKIYGVYLTEDGNVSSFCTEVPLSFYVQLDKDFTAQDRCQILPAVSELEAEKIEANKLHLKAGVIAQYVVADQECITVTEDMYSPLRDLELDIENIKLPVLCECEGMHGNCDVDVAMGEENPVVFGLENVTQTQDELDGSCVVSGMVRVLDYDEMGELTIKKLPWSITASCCSKSNEDTGTMCVSADIDNGKITVCALEAKPAVKEVQIRSVIGGEMSEMREPCADRPSLILRKAGNCDLWELSKKCGSSADKIRKLNGLEDEPEPNKMLLIPVL